MTSLKETLVEKLFLSATFASGSIVLLIFGFMLYYGLPLFTGGHFFDLITQIWLPQNGVYGILPMITGSLVISVFSLIIALPLSLGCALLIAGLAPPKVGLVLRKMVELMTGIPTVIYGFAGIFLLVPIVRGIFENSGLCILSAALMLAVLISPTMILFFNDSFKRVPQSYLNAVDALGASKVQKLLFVVLPNSWRGVVSGLIISLGRALGDTMIALMLAGNAVQVPHSLLDSARTLTSHIALIFAADYESMEFKAIFACGILLYLFTTILVLAIRSIASSERDDR